MRIDFRKSTLIIAGFLTIAAAANRAAQAATIPNATFSQSATTGTLTDTLSTPGTVSESTTGRNGNVNLSAQASITGGLDPSVSASASAQNLGSLQTPSATAIADMTYYFEITGATGPTTIHIKGQGGFGGGNAASANLVVSGSEGTILDLLGHSQNTGGGVDSNFTVNTNEVYTVSLSAEVIAIASTGALVQGSASIDPTIVLVASDPVGSVLNFSPNLVTAPAVTSEPATLLTLGGSLVSFALLLRRRVRSQHALQAV
jgi:hypothetical protein